MQSSPGPVKVADTTLITRWYDGESLVIEVGSPLPVTLGAYGLAVWLAGQPEHWVSSVAQVQQTLAVGPPYALRERIAELVKAGLLVQDRTASGAPALRVALTLVLPS